MEFKNLTQCAAELFRSEFEPDHLHNSLLVRTRFTISEGMLSETDGPEDIRREMVETEFGTLPPDIFFSGPGTDLIVFGDAVIKGEPVTEHAVRISVLRNGSTVYDLPITVTGDRYWERNLTGSLVSSKPLPFTVMPVSYKNAFGGKVSSENGEIAFIDNPVGKGFYLSEKQAHCNPLPNIEISSMRIAKWDDRPKPAGCGPYLLQWGLRAVSVVDVNQSDGSVTFNPDKGFFNHAYPDLSCQQLETGDLVVIKGMDENGDIRFSLPQCPLEVEIKLGGKTFIRQMHIEEIAVDMRNCKVDITYRYKFDYTFIPHQKRTTTVRRKES